MKIILDGFFLALSFFTVLPSKKEINIVSSTYKYMLIFFPLIGAILAFLTILIYLVLQEYFHSLYAALVAAIIYLFLYGFLHLEAICDVVDAWFAKYSNKDVYEIMKEPHIGAIGAIFCFVFILLKVAIIAYILYEEHFALLFFALIFSRLNVIFALGNFTFHKNSFMALSLKEHASFKLLLFSFLYVLLMFFIDTGSLLLFVLSLIVFFLVLNILKKRFSFLNGDCIGFTLEVNELIILNLGFILL